MLQDFTTGTLSENEFLELFIPDKTYRANRDIRIQGATIPYKTVRGVPVFNPLKGQHEMQMRENIANYVALQEVEVKSRFKSVRKQRQAMRPVLKRVNKAFRKYGIEFKLKPSARDGHTVSAGTTIRITAKQQ
jgi:hypothetical protein|tara:strand:- start:1158 stop:1556 length:399 start_codon:yes stop_codon:yes gene_type:complete